MEFNWSRRGLKKIKNLPSNLLDFNCSYNQITKIENLPSNLKYFYCFNNQITKIENLPQIEFKQIPLLKIIIVNLLIY